MPDVNGSPGGPARRGRARATRQRIAKAAYALFCERGFGGTTMTRVAAAAGVAVQTVYFIFHTKSDLLSAAIDLAVFGDDDPAPPDEQPWFKLMSAEPSLRLALRHLVSGVAEIEARVAPLDAAIRAAAAIDPGVTRVQARHDELQAEAYRAIIRILTVKQPLRPGLTVGRAVDLLLLLVGGDVFRVLVIERGWSPAAWIDWTVSAVAELIFGA